MKTRTPAAALALLLAFAATWAGAQTRTATMRRSVPNYANSFNLPISGEFARFDLSFPGGAPEELAEAIEAASGEPLNLIVPEALRGVRLPLFRVRGVTTPELLATLKEVGPVIETERMTGGERLLFRERCVFVPNPASGEIGPTTIWTLKAEEVSVEVLYPPETRVQVFKVSEQINHGYSIQDIGTAISLTWELIPRDQLGKFEYHEDTELLIVTASPAKMDAVQNVLTMLQTGLSAARQEKDDPFAQP